MALASSAGNMNSGEYSKARASDKMRRVPGAGVSDGFVRCEHCVGSRIRYWKPIDAPVCGSNGHAPSGCISFDPAFLRDFLSLLADEDARRQSAAQKFRDDERARKPGRRGSGKLCE